MWAVGFLLGIVGGVVAYAIYLTIVTLIRRKKEKTKKANANTSDIENN